MVIANKGERETGVTGDEAQGTKGRRKKRGEAASVFGRLWAPVSVGNELVDYQVCNDAEVCFLFWMRKASSSHTGCGYTPFTHLP